jgi:hypothetical protein
MASASVSLNVTFDSIPVEIWSEIFSFLDAKTLGRCALVCCTWMQVSQQGRLWKALSSTLGLDQLPPSCDDWKTFYQQHYFWRWDTKNSSSVVFSLDNLTVCTNPDKRRYFPHPWYGGAVGAVTWTSGRHHWQIQASGKDAEWSELGVVNRKLMEDVTKFKGPGVFALANDNQRYPAKNFATREKGRDNPASADQWIIDRYIAGDVVNIVFDADEHWISWSVHRQELLLMENLPPGPYSPFAIVSNPRNSFTIVGWTSIGDYVRLPAPGLSATDQ